MNCNNSKKEKEKKESDSIESKCLITLSKKGKKLERQKQNVKVNRH